MSIQEMSEKEFPIKSWEEIRAGNNCRRIYCMGANAVLEEIEAVLNKGNESRCDDFFTIAEIERKIKQLKK